MFRRFLKNPEASGDITRLDLAMIRKIDDICRELPGIVAQYYKIFYWKVSLVQFGSHIAQILYSRFRNSTTSLAVHSSIITESERVE